MKSYLSGRVSESYFTLRGQSVNCWLKKRYRPFARSGFRWPELIVIVQVPADVNFPDLQVNVIPRKGAKLAVPHASVDGQSE